jgi:hypothetical protein
VTSILEGSLKKQPIKCVLMCNWLTREPFHLWANYDRKLTDILGIESEIAKGIAESLQTKLSGPAEQALAAKPTSNPEAYEEYLRGVAFQGRVYTSNHFMLKATGYFERAVQLDPNFAAAWARLARAHAHLYFQRLDSARPDTAKMRWSMRRKLQPGSPETLRH